MLSLYQCRIVTVICKALFIGYRYDFGSDLHPFLLPFHERVTMFGGRKTISLSKTQKLNNYYVILPLVTFVLSRAFQTYSGLFCVAINPYRRLPIYLDSIIAKYRGKRKMEMPPHLFAVADTAFQNMLQGKHPPKYDFSPQYVMVYFSICM